MAPKGLLSPWGLRLLLWLQLCGGAAADCCPPEAPWLLIACIVLGAFAFLLLVILICKCLTAQPRRRAVPQRRFRGHRGDPGDRDGHGHDDAMEIPEYSGEDPGAEPDDWETPSAPEEGPEPWGAFEECPACDNEF